MKYLFWVIAGIFLFSACNSGRTYDFSFSEEAVAEGDSVIELMIDSLPSYEALIQNTEKTNAAYQGANLIPARIVLSEDYDRAAVQTGMLIMDASYCRYHQRVQRLMEYQAILKDAFDRFDIPQQALVAAVEQLEYQPADADTVLQVLSDAYLQTTKEIRNSQRPALAALVITGAWLESSYLMCFDLKTQSQEFDTERKKRRLHLSLIYRMLGYVEGPYLPQIRQGMQEIITADSSGQSDQYVARVKQLRNESLNLTQAIADAD